jgi:hypothetical protein
MISKELVSVVLDLDIIEHFIDDYNELVYWDGQVYIDPFDGRAEQNIESEIEKYKKKYSWAIEYANSQDERISEWITKCNELEAEAERLKDT